MLSVCETCRDCCDGWGINKAPNRKIHFFFFLIWLNSTARSCLSKHQKSLGARKVLVFSSSFINPPPRQNIFSLVYSISHSYRSGIEGIEWKSLRGNFFFPVEVSSKEKKNKCTKNKKNRSQSLEWDMWPTTGEEWRFDKARRSYVSELESSDTPYLDLELIGVTNLSANIWWKLYWKRPFPLLER